MAAVRATARTNSGLLSRPATWATRAPPGHTARAARAGSGYGRSTGAAPGFSPGWERKDQTRPAGPGLRELPDPAPLDRHRPGVLSPAAAGVHRPWPARTSMRVMVTDPVTEPGLITGPDGGGAAIVRLASRHGQPVSWAVAVREPRTGPRYTGVCPTAPTARSYTSRIRVPPAGLTARAWKLTRTWLPRSTTGGGAGGSSALVSDGSGRPAAQ